jgi:hypothetical protein
LHVDWDQTEKERVQPIKVTRAGQGYVFTKLQAALERADLDQKPTHYDALTLVSTALDLSDLCTNQCSLVNDGVTCRNKTLALIARYHF